VAFALAGLAAGWVAADARRRGKGFAQASLWGFGVLLAPLIVLLLWLYVRPKRMVAGVGGALEPDSNGAQRTRVCGYCGMFYRSAGAQCPHCGHPAET
jgi:hypothetical protein